MLTLATCEVGYAIANDMRGGSNSTSTVAFWLIAAVLAGPPLGIAGAWSTHRGLRRGVGFAVIAGVLIGEGIYGWTTVADTTDWRYWAVEMFAGVAIVLVTVTVAVRHSGHRVRDVLAAIATALVTAAVVFTFGRLA